MVVENGKHELWGDVWSNGN